MTDSAHEGKWGYLIGHRKDEQGRCTDPHYEKDEQGRCIMHCVHGRIVHEIETGSGWEHSDDETECD